MKAPGNIAVILDLATWELIEEAIREAAAGTVQESRKVQADYFLAARELRKQVNAKIRQYGPEQRPINLRG